MVPFVLPCTGSSDVQTVQCNHVGPSEGPLSGAWSQVATLEVHEDGLKAEARTEEVASQKSDDI